MHALGDKVAKNLSRFWPGSPSSAEETHESSQANLLSKGVCSLSFFFSFKHPLPAVKVTEEDFKSALSSPVRWNSNGCASMEAENINFQADCVQRDACRELASPFNKHESSVTAASTFASEIFEDAVDSESNWKLMPNLTDDSAFMCEELYEFIQACLPNIVKGRKWVLLYSTLKHGISLRTLIRKSADLSGPGVLIVGDRKGAVFGGLLDCPLKPCTKRKYQGTHQTFVFTTRYGQPRLFRATGANRYFYLCQNDFLAFGGGENFALTLDGDLLSGRSGSCDTFGNACLAHDTEFELENVELWGFAHLSRYRI